MIARLLILLLLLMGVAAPAATRAQEAPASASASFSRDGIFGCGGASYGAVGIQGPTGSFVPVFDAALFDQQRLLTYKECLLDGIARSAKEAVTAGLVKVTLEWANGATTGTPAFVTDPERQALEIENQAVIDYFESDQFKKLPQVYQDEVRAQLIQEYAQDTRQDGATRTCPLNDAQLAVLRTGGIPQDGGIEAQRVYIMNPSCTRMGAITQARADLSARRSTAVDTNRTLLEWGNGFLSQFKEQVVQLGNGETTTQRQIVTPGYLIAQQLSQVLGTGLRQAENANEIDSLVSNALVNLGTRMLTDVNGFAGLTQALGGQPSYVNQLAIDSANRAREKMVGAAAAILNNSLSTEQEYHRAQLAAQGLLNNAQTNLQNWENQCYSDMADQAEAEVVDRIRARVCPASVGTSTVPCAVAIDVTRTYDPDTLDVTAPTPTTLTISGGSVRADSRMELTISTSASSTTPVEPLEVTANNRQWKFEDVSIAGVASGTLTIAVTEYFRDGSGTHGPATALVDKAGVGDVVVLTLPTTLPSVTITANASSYTESITLSRSREHSDEIATVQIAPNIRIVEERVADAERALAALVELRSALSAATSVAGQREVLAILDRLVAEHRLHSTSDVRTAQGHNNELEGNLRQVMEATRTEWESGWCDPDNWEDHVI